MKKYVIIRQDVDDTGVDDINIHGTYESLDAANAELKTIIERYYPNYKTKLLRNEYLFLYRGHDSLFGEGCYTARIYYRIKQLEK